MHHFTWTVLIIFTTMDYVPFAYTNPVKTRDTCKPSDIFFNFSVLCETSFADTNWYGSLEGSCEGNGHSAKDDVFLTTPELIAKYGYPSESHEIVTEDGYILVLHRIPHGRESISKGANAKPIYLQHGFSAASDDWVAAGPDCALAYVLADAGFDVWIGNNRGNKWGRRHLTLSPDESAFWDTSWHEMGVYDLPAAIDYILNETEAEKVYYAGHSMGSALFLVMASEKPKYNHKIAMAVLMAPGVYFPDSNNTLGNMALFLTPLPRIWKMAQFFGVNEILKPSKDNVKIASKCRQGDLERRLCIELAKEFKINVEYLNEAFLPSVLAHHPSGAALKNVFHYFQTIKAGIFQQFNNGPVGNLIKYGNEYPPAYDFSRISAPVAIHYADNDGVVMPEGALLLAEQLPNVIGVHAIHDEKFNHNDFLYATKAKELQYEFLIQQLNEH